MRGAIDVAPSPEMAYYICATSARAEHSGETAAVTRKRGAAGGSATNTAQTAHINAAGVSASPPGGEPQQSVSDRTQTTAKITAKTPVATQTRLKAATGAVSSQTPLPVVISGAKQEPSLRAPGRRFFGGRRSRTARFTLWTVAVVAAFVFLMGATPLGQSGPLGGTFQAYAQSVPWIAPPTATPKPVNQRPAPGVNPGQQAIIDKITAVFGPYATGAINVARCESDFDPNAWNSIAIGGSHAAGVFQILYPSTWNGTSFARYSPYAADANIRAAHEIFVRDGYSWREWACRP
jgi:hypothetical protein